MRAIKKSLWFLMMAGILLPFTACNSGRVVATIPDCNNVIVYKNKVGFKTEKQRKKNLKKARKAHERQKPSF